MKLIIPNLFMAVDYEKEVPLQVKQRVEKMLFSRKGMYICGPAGVGKTHIAYAIARFFEKDGYKIDFFNTSNLLQQIREEFEEKPTKKTYQEIINSKGLLILDDIGAEKITDWVREIFYLIINTKYEEMMPVVFTSNYGLEELAEKMGERIVSRIAGMCDILKLEGNDRRVK